MRARRTMQHYQKKPLILIVDDHPHILGLLGDILRLEGYSIHTAVDGQEAFLSKANRERLAEYVAEGLVQRVYQKPLPPIVTLLEEVDRLTAQLPHR